jgi:TPP-dependent pyruvate/acetoin dehydrogenase alpha subunit
MSDVPTSGKSKTKVATNSLSLAELSALYETMMLIRRCEDSLSTLFAEGAIPGFIHLSIGQEAVSAGIMSSLSAQDTIASTHRGHGHALAKGMDVQAFFFELMGKDEGLCRGRGGSMHVADCSIGMLGANGIVGAGIPISLGSALAHQVQGNDAIAVAFFGDGATAEGVLHECFNMAALWKLPLLFACETNGWSEFSPSASQIAVSLPAFAAAFGIGYTKVDGNDVSAVALTARSIVADIRGGGGPHLIDCHTTRVRGHFEGDAQKYRAEEELAGTADCDPLPKAAAELLQLGLSSEGIDQIEVAVRGRVDDAIARARNGADPDFADAAREVYTVGQGA